MSWAARRTAVILLLAVFLTGGAAGWLLEDVVDVNPVPVHAVVAAGRHRLPKIRACVDYWAEWFGRDGQPARERAA